MYNKRFVFIIPLFVSFCNGFLWCCLKEKAPPSEIAQIRMDFSLGELCFTERVVWLKEKHSFPLIVYIPRK